MVTVSIDFSGGLELLFGNVKSFARVAIDSDNGTDVVTMRIALAWMKDHMLKERPELFLHGESMCVPNFSALNTDLFNPLWPRWCLCKLRK